MAKVNLFEFSKMRKKFEKILIWFSKLQENWLDEMSKIDQNEVIRRNYEQFFMVDIKEVPNSDQYIYKHVNG